MAQASIPPPSEPEQRDTTFKVQTTADYKKSGIYSAQRDDTTKPVVIDWGDGTVEEVNGNVSQKVHTYASVGTFEATVSNVKTFAASANNQTWYTTTSQNQYTLKEVVFGASVTNIGDFAFSYCNGLTSVTISDGVTSIGVAAFFSCSGLANVTIPDSVTSIGDQAFSHCIGLRSVVIPNSVISIGAIAFEHCNGLMSITIPQNVINIGQWAFSYCVSLTTAIFENRTITQMQSILHSGDWFCNSGQNNNVTIVCTDGSIVVYQTGGGAG